MKRKRILIAVILIVGAVVCGTAAAVVYYYTHPNSLAPVIERFVSRATGTRCTIEGWAVDLSPLRVRVEGIRCEPPEGSDLFRAELSRVGAKLTLEGPFGTRRLVVDELAIDKFSVSASGIPTLPPGHTGDHGHSALGRLLSRMVGMFLFTDVEIRSVRVKEGELAGRFGQYRGRLGSITGRMTAERHLDLACSVQLDAAGDTIALTVPSLTVSTEGAFSVAHPSLTCMVNAAGGAFRSPRAEAGSVDLQARLTYDHDLGRVVCPSASFACSGLMASVKAQPVPFAGAVTASAEGTLDLTARTLDLPRVGVRVERTEGRKGARFPVASLDCAIRGGFGPGGTLSLEELHGTLHPDRAGELLAQVTEQGPIPVRVTGPLAFTGSVTGTHREEKWQWDTDLQLLLEGIPVDFQHPRIRAEGALKGTVQVKGAPSGFSLDADIRVDNSLLRYDGTDTGHGSCVFTGPIALTGSVTGDLSEGKRQWGTDLHLLLEGSPFDYRHPRIRAEGALAGSIRVTGAPSGFSAGMDLRAGDSRLRYDGADTGRGSCELAGPVALTGTLRGAVDESPASWQWHGTAGLEGAQCALAIPRFEGSTILDAELALDGPLADLRAAGRIRGESTALSFPGGTAAAFAAEATFSGTQSLVVLDRVTARLPALTLKAGEKTAGMNDLRITASHCRYDLAKGSWSVPEVSCSSSLFDHITLSGHGTGTAMHGSVRGTGTGLLACASGLVPGWRYGGVDTIEAEIDRRRDGAWAFASTARVKELTFQNKDGRIAGEKIAFAADARGTLSADARALTAEVSAAAPAGECLLDRFYFDLGSHPASLRLRGSCDLRTKEVTLSSAEFGLDTIVRATLAGTVSAAAVPPAFRLTLEMPETPVEPLYRYFVTEPFRSEKPFLANMTAGGTVSAKFDLNGRGRVWAVKGRCGLAGGTIASGDGTVSADNITLDLPVWYGKGAEHLAGPPLRGSVSIERVVLPFLPVQALEFVLAARPGVLEATPVRPLTVPGGDITLGPVTVTGLVAPPLSVDTSIAADSIDLDPVLSPLWGRPVQGRVSGRLSPVRLRGESVTCDGILSVTMFGGNIALSGFSAYGLFSSTPAVTVSARLRDLLLSELTTGTSFGKIQGVVTGHVTDLEFAAGQPQGFDLLLETRQTKGIPQRISVRALDNISRIGGGSSPFTGMAGMFTSLFNEFPYGKIGIRSSLRNDVFRVNGTIMEGGSEYLVKRSGFSGVNVINQNPDNRIGFKDMVKRIKRITASAKGPAVH